MSFFKMGSGYKEKKCNSICINFENLSQRVEKMNSINYLSGFWRRQQVYTRDELTIEEN